MRALRRFTVRPGLPAPLAELHTLAMNLRWTWHPGTQDLFEAVDPDVWRQVDADPLRLLAEVPAATLDRLATDADFLARIDAAADDLRRYLTEPRWYQERTTGREHVPAAIAYFSMEFGVSEVLPNYSGGLGVLAGDQLKAASDLGVPLIGVGLLYRSGYFRQSLSLDGWQVEHYPVIDPRGLPLEPLTEPSGAPVLLDLAMPARRRAARADLAGPGGPGAVAAAGLRHPAERAIRTCGRSPTGSTAATPTTASGRRSWPASAACGPCAATAS